MRFVYENLVLDGTPPLETNYFIVLNGTDGSSSNAGDNVVFDRSGYRFHGRVKIIAETLKENGISI